MPKIEKRYWLIVIDSGEEIELKESTYRTLFKDFQEGKSTPQISFNDISEKSYIEQRHNIRMRETQDVIY